MIIHDLIPAISNDASVNQAPPTGPQEKIKSIGRVGEWQQALWRRLLLCIGCLILNLSMLTTASAADLNVGFGGGNPFFNTLTATPVSVPPGAVGSETIIDVNGCQFTYTVAPPGVYVFHVAYSGPGSWTAWATSPTGTNSYGTQGGAPGGTFSFTYNRYPSLPYCDPCSHGAGNVAGNAAPSEGVPTDGAPEGPDTVRLGDGAVIMSETDVSSAGTGGFGLTRTYGSDSASSAPVAGTGWLIEQRPSIQNTYAGVAVTSSPKSSISFNLSGSSYVPILGAQESLTHGSSQYVLTDTLGNVSTFFDFTVTPAAEQGQLKSFTDKAGNITTFTYDGSGNLTSSQTSVTTAGVTTINTQLYHYTSGLIDTVKSQQTIGGVGPTTIRQALYSYYTGVSGDFGLNNELKSVNIEDGSGNILTNTIIAII